MPGATIVLDWWHAAADLIARWQAAGRAALRQPAVRFEHALQAARKAATA
jgi:hypothetical protein